MSVFLRTGNREDLEREVLRSIRQRGYCYAHDGLLSDQLAATTPGQVLAWQQSFCERGGLTARPYREHDGGGSGVIFETSGKEAAFE